MNLDEGRLGLWAAHLPNRYLQDFQKGALSDENFRLPTNAQRVGGEERQLATAVPSTELTAGSISGRCCNAQGASEDSTEAALVR